MTSIAFIVLTHERPHTLKHCLSSLVSLKDTFSSFEIHIACTDNSIVASASNKEICNNLNIEIFQQCGASQVDNFIQALEIAKQFPFFCLMHDDDIIVPHDEHESKLKALSSDTIYCIPSSIVNPKLTKSKSHIVDFRRISSKRFLKASFPHRLPLFPSYIYPNHVIDRLTLLLKNKRLRNSFGKHYDTYMIISLLNENSLLIQELQLGTYLYFVHSGQDSAVISPMKKLALFVWLYQQSNNKLLDRLAALIYFFDDIIKCTIKSMLFSSAT
jgi:hypothetical protein